jgi:hypothetical protein
MARKKKKEKCRHWREQPLTNLAFGCFVFALFLYNTKVTSHVVSSHDSLERRGNATKRRGSCYLQRHPKRKCICRSSRQGLFQETRASKGSSSVPKCLHPLLFLGSCVWIRYQVRNPRLGTECPNENSVAQRYVIAIPVTDDMVSRTIDCLSL